MAARKTEAPMSLEEYQAAQEAEWNTYVANEPIYIGGALAFLAGHKVPAGHVTSELVSAEQVTRVNASPAEKEI